MRGKKYDEKHDREESIGKRERGERVRDQDGQRDGRGKRVHEKEGGNVRKTVRRVEVGEEKVEGKCGSRGKEGKGGKNE